MSKTKQREFQKAICDGLRELGVRDNDIHYKFVIDTPLGDLFITVHDSDIENKSKIYSVYARFEDTERARKKTGCNPYSGKWNFNFHVEDDPIETANRIIDRIRNIVNLEI